MTEKLLCALALAGMMLAPSWANAAQYEVFIDVDDEEQLYDLQVAGEIGDGTFEVLVDLIRQGVDLNTASRQQLYALPNLNYDEVDSIIAYREEAGRISNPAALVLAGALSRRKLESIAAFLIVPNKEGGQAGVRGQVRYQTIFTSGDERVPPMALQARVSTLRYLTVGAAGLVDRNQLQQVTWDPNREALASEGFKTRARVPKYYAKWDTPKWGVIAGTYNIGFGQRLVFDTTGNFTPNGFTLDDTIYRDTDLTTECRESAGELADSPCPTNARRNYVSPDYFERPRQRGVAVGAKKIELPEGWMQAYGFFSHQTMPIYQYGIYNRDICDDPRRDTDLFPECSSPDVFISDASNPLAPAPTVRFARLPNMYNEIHGGGNVSYFLNRRTHAGVTAYGSSVDWLVEGANLDFQEWQRTPYGGPFGAAGADMSWGYKWADVFAEVAYSFDSVDNDGGGGPAALLRSTATWNTHEIEASGRYYSSQYQNPYARPIANADQSNGLRATDEAGGRLRYSGTIAEKLDLRTFVDVWHELSTQRTKFRTFARGDLQVLEWLRPGLWAEYQSQDVSGRGRDRCFRVFGSGEEAASDAGVDSVSFTDFVLGVDNGGCDGTRIRITPRVRFDPHRRVSIQAQFQYDWVDDPRFEARFANDVRLVGIVGANPIDPLRLRFRIAYDNDAVRESDYLEETLWAYLQVAYRFESWMQPSLRYDIRAWLDDRESTAFRSPNPEHWVMLQVLSQF